MNPNDPRRKLPRMTPEERMLWANSHNLPEGMMLWYKDEIDQFTGGIAVLRKLLDKWKLIGSVFFGSEVPEEVTEAVNQRRTETVDALKLLERAEEAFARAPHGGAVKGDGEALLAEITAFLGTRNARPPSAPAAVGEGERSTEWRHTQHDGELYLEFRRKDGPWVDAGIFFPQPGFTVGDFLEMVGQLRSSPPRPSAERTDGERDDNYWRGYKARLDEETAQQPESKNPTLWRYLQNAFEKQITFHTIGVNRMPDGGFHFYIHPQSVSGETEDYLIWPDPFSWEDMLVNKKDSPAPDVEKFTKFLARAMSHSPASKGTGRED